MRILCQLSVTHSRLYLKIVYYFHSFVSLEIHSSSRCRSIYAYCGLLYRNRKNVAVYGCTVIFSTFCGVLVCIASLVSAKIDCVYSVYLLLFFIPFFSFSLLVFLLLLLFSDPHSSIVHIQCDCIRKSTKSIHDIKRKTKQSKHQQKGWVLSEREEKKAKI